MDTTISSMGSAPVSTLTGRMTTPKILILGGTGKTGRRVLTRLRNVEADVRAASRHGSDIQFDWDDPGTHGAALDGADVVYLVPPTRRTVYAETVSAFLDRAEAAGVRHVTQLSARGVDQAPPEVAPRAVELDLAARRHLSHTVVRPGWFMQNFSEDFFLPAGDGIAAPTGGGAEAFVHTEDIAEVVAATLLDPEAHAGRGYTLTGPGALTFAQVAEHITRAAGRPITHVDQSRTDWVAAQVSAGWPEDYAQILARLLDEVVRAGGGAATTDDVRLVTGHAPRSFATYASEPETIAAWQSVRV
jgi:uncharacterized protein YbjT (DUF2867 family)